METILIDGVKNTEQNTETHSAKAGMQYRNSLSMSLKSRQKIGSNIQGCT